jgi:hypothetical protein
MSGAPDLVSALLAADLAEREQLVRAADAATLAPTVAVLGHTRDSRAAEVLATIDALAEDRSVRKAARREVHRLRSIGIEAPVVPSAPAPAAATAARSVVEVSEAWGTDSDPSGARALWLVGDRPLGGVWLGALVANDQDGLQDLNLVDTTRKRFQRDFDQMQARREAGTWVSLPGEYALRLVREAVDLTRELGGGLPTRYQAFREVFGEAPGPPERAIVYDAISPVEINFNPDWLEESPRLLGEPELAGWYVPVPAELRTRAIEVARAPSAGLLVPGHTPEQQTLQLVADTARQALTPVVRRGLRRRLEETAYIFLATDRLAVARVAAAAAHALQDGGVPPERHPLLRLLLAAGLARLTGSETVGGRRASEVLLEQVERASAQQTQGGGVETRPSGLILPR